MLKFNCIFQGIFDNLWKICQERRRKILALSISPYVFSFKFSKKSSLMPAAFQMFLPGFTGFPSPEKPTS